MCGNNPGDAVHKTAALPPPQSLETAPCASVIVFRCIVVHRIDILQFSI